MFCRPLLSLPIFRFQRHQSLTLWSYAPHDIYKFLNVLPYASIEVPEKKIRIICCTYIQVADPSTRHGLWRLVWIVTPLGFTYFCRYLTLSDIRWINRWSAADRCEFSASADWFLYLYFVCLESLSPHKTLVWGVLVRYACDLLKWFF